MYFAPFRIFSVKLFLFAFYLRDLKRIMYWAFRLISELNFPFGNAFWSIRVTLALRWQTWVKSFDTMALSVAWSMRSSRLEYDRICYQYLQDYHCTRVDLAQIEYIFQVFSAYQSNIVATDRKTSWL